MQWREGRAALWLMAIALPAAVQGCTAAQAAAATPRLAVHLSAAQRQALDKGPSIVTRDRWNVVVRAELRFRAEPGAASRAWGMPAPSPGSSYPL